MEKVIGNKSGRSTVTPTVTEENLANKTFQLTDFLHREIIPPQAVMH